jgi:hypothetical protein
MQVVQTAGDPPNRGKSLRAIIGSMTNSSEAPSRRVPLKRTGKPTLPPTTHVEM